MINTTENKTPLIHPSFQQEHQWSIPSLGIECSQFVHRKTGATHLHLASDKQENVFLLGFATVPKDSTGVAHILEHTVLCGSERYPVRDPFFMMMRRSLSTFMNAFTASDWTAFPFATENKKDFTHLLSVYLDAAFFSRLHPLDFAQEGHRYEFSSPTDPQSPLEIKGVVYNEMKGAMSAPSSYLYQRMKQAIFSHSTYHFNSGGEPDVIPSLTYEALLQFYRAHYHPTNSFICTFGDIPVHEHHQTLDECLSRFDRGIRAQIPPEPARFAPVTIEDVYPTQDSQAKSYFTIGWRLPTPLDSAEELALDLLNMLLTGNSAAPLQHALETAGFGTPSPLTGVIHIGQEAMFCAGFQDCDPGNAEAMTHIIHSTLQRCAQEGFAQSDIEAGLFRLEMQQKQITGHSQPFGLELALDAMTAFFYNQPICDALDISPVIQTLKERLQDKHYLSNVLREHVIDNPHQVRLMLNPGTTIASKKNEHYRTTLAHIASHMDEPAQQHIVQQAQALEERQSTQDDPDILPKLTRADIPAKKPTPTPYSETGFANTNHHISEYAANTNGLCYLSITASLPQLDISEIQDLRFMLHAWTEVGTGKKPYTQVQKDQYGNTGYLNANINSRSGPEQPDQIHALTVMSACTLNERFGTMLELLHEQYFNPRFDELPRIKELYQQQRQRYLNSITHAGHQLAMNAASASFHRFSRFNSVLSGLEFIQSLKQSNTDVDYEAKAHAFQSLHRKICQCPVHFALVGQEDALSGWRHAISESWATPGIEPQPMRSIDPAPQQATAWLTSTDISFCAMALPAVDRLHPKAPVLSILAQIMDNVFLHTALREKGGAYGGGAIVNTKSQTFEFYSYRDPRIKGTFDDFDRAMEWAMNHQFTEQQIEEAVLSIISNIDKPSSPSGEALTEFYHRRHGRSPEQRQAFRSALLEVTPEALHQAAHQHFNTNQKIKVVVTNRDLYDSEKLSEFTPMDL